MKIKDCCLWTLRTTAMRPRYNETTRKCVFCKKPWHWADGAWWPGPDDTNNGQGVRSS